MFTIDWFAQLLTKSFFKKPKDEILLKKIQNWYKGYQIWHLSKEFNVHVFHIIKQFYIII